MRPAAQAALGCGGQARIPRLCSVHILLGKETYDRTDKTEETGFLRGRKKSHKKSHNRKKCASRGLNGSALPNTIAAMLC